LNARDNGLNVIVGVRKDGTSWKQAMEDGWVPGKNLFEVEEAIKKGTIVMNLLSVCLFFALTDFRMLLKAKLGPRSSPSSPKER
jgi:Acetohydroxy acid isomeroreductase, NADPH-binding domain